MKDPKLSAKTVRKPKTYNPNFSIFKGIHGCPEGNLRMFVTLVKKTCEYAKN